MYAKTSGPSKGAERVWEAGNTSKEVRGRQQSGLGRKKVSGDEAKPARAETRTEQLNTLISVRRSHTLWSVARSQV